MDMKPFLFISFQQTVKNNLNPLGMYINEYVWDNSWLGVP